MSALFDIPGRFGVGSLSGLRPAGGGHERGMDPIQVHDLGVTPETTTECHQQQNMYIVQYCTSCYKKVYISLAHLESDDWNKECRKDIKKDRTRRLGGFSKKQCRKHTYCLETRVLQRDVVYLGWPTAPLYMSLNAGDVGELRGLSQWVQLYTGAQINCGDLIPYLKYLQTINRHL